MAARLNKCPSASSSPHLAGEVGEAADHFKGGGSKCDRSLEQIRRDKLAGHRTKSGIMLGLGEKADEVHQAMDDLVANRLDILTLGQYLQPTKRHLDVVEFIHPDPFAAYKEEGLKRRRPEAKKA